ncbi:MAG: alpha/beta hydrolase [Wenzhouxiangellaceae bacterium]|nr:alpha/beta hydrolase [Wenzhouxiangellaceae bacterium]
MAQVRIFFATNRKFRKRADGVRFEAEINKPIDCEFRVGRADIELDGQPGNRSYALIAGSVHIYPERRMRSDADCEAIVKRDDLPAEIAFPKAREQALEAAETRERLGSSEMFAEIQTDMRAQACDALLYIHGFNNSFADAIEAAAELADRYRGEGVELLVVLFSWPSEGKLLPPNRYFSDRTAAELSGMAIGRALARLRDLLRDFARLGQPCQQRLHLMAHSMGNYALRFAVRALVWQHAAGGLLPVFEHAFLMAADADDDALEIDDALPKLQALARIAQNIHVYHSKGDRALWASDWTKGNPDRLGARGPRNIERVDERVTAIDCRKVDETEGDSGNHNYFRRRPEVIADVAAVLRGLGPEEIENRRALAPRRFRLDRKD